MSIPLFLLLIQKAWPEVNGGDDDDEDDDSK